MKASNLTLVLDLKRPAFTLNVEQSTLQLVPFPVTVEEYARVVGLQRHQVGLDGALRAQQGLEMADMDFALVDQAGEDQINLLGKLLPRRPRSGPFPATTKSASHFLCVPF